MSGIKQGALHNGPSKIQTAASRAELTAPLIKAARWALADGHTLEECLSAVVTAAQREWSDVRIVIERSAHIRVDGIVFLWPEEEETPK
jgi:hypothetical protein